MTSAAEGTAGRAAAWLYTGLWRALVGWFRVPRDAPAVPGAGDEAPDAFRPDLAFVRYLKLWFWIVAIVIDLALLVAWIAIAVVAPWWVAALLAPVALALAIVPDIIAYVAIHLRYDTTWYVMTDRSLRIRRGIWIIHETTITFENVQNVKVQQGPVQRMFGVSSLIVETAGAGGDSGSKGLGIANQGVIEGVADPQALRDRILTRLKTSRSAGLGDEDDAGRSAASGTGAGAAWSPRHLAVLREIHDELRSIRTT